MSPNNNSSQERPNFFKISYLDRLKDMIMECIKCKKDKDLSEFYLTSIGKPNGLTCKNCKKAAAKELYHANGGIETLREWRKANPGRYEAQHKRASNNRLKKAKEDPIFREYVNKMKRENARKNFIAGMVGRARQRATRLKILFDITVGDIVIPEVCPILGIPFILGTKRDYQNSPSIDRVRPAEGYVKGNIAVITTLANTMKNSATSDQLLTFCENIPNYLKKYDIV